MAVHDTIQVMKRKGSRLAEPLPVEGMPPMTFACTFSEKGANAEDVGALPYECPDDLREFWSEAQTARLFEDREYGQWGLEIFDPKHAADVTDQCRSERQQDFVEGDLVVGRFLGDSDMLMIRCDPTASDFGSVIVALPLDPRSDWEHVTESFAEFLDRYAESSGEKFWEQGDS